MTQLQKGVSAKEYPVALPNWDHTPRSGKKAIVLQNTRPELFGKIITHCIQSVQERSFDERIVFLKAWNEWAEGNFLETEQKFGKGYLDVIKKFNCS